MIPEHLKSRMDPVYAAWLEASNPPVPEGFEPTLAQMRQAFITQAEVSNGALDTSLEIVDHPFKSREGHNIKTRLYRHRDVAEPQPVCIFMHGGGWVLGDLNTHQGLCADLATESGASVLAIDYRLSPEHHFPCALHDVLDVLEQLEQAASPLGLDAGRFILIGDSAGANLAAAAALSGVQNARQARAMVLVYPALGADIQRPSFIEMQELPGLTPELMRFFFTSYIGGDELPDALAAPLTCKDKSALPATYISAAELDPLRDDASDFAKDLSTAKVANVLQLEKGLGHGYLWLRNQTDPAREAFTRICTFIREELQQG